MSNRTQHSVPPSFLAGAIGIAVVFVLIVIGGLEFFPAFFIGLLVAVGVVLYLIYGRRRSAPEPERSERAVSDARGAPEATTADRAPASTAPETAARTPSQIAAEDGAPTGPAPSAPATPSAPTPVAPEPAAPAEVAGAEKRPETLSAPRDGKADDLKQIKGIGPKLEKLCNALGFYHYDQIAWWTDEEIAWVDDNLEGFKGRVTRDAWVEQARQLAKDNETESGAKADGGRDD